MLKKSKIFLLALSAIFLNGCVTDMQDFPLLKAPGFWKEGNAEKANITDQEGLKSWWENFEDPVMNELVQRTLEGSPDRKIAKARIMEARGLSRTARSFQFPQLGFSGNGNRQDFGFAGPGDFFETGFDASYEIDVFGRVRNSIDASSAAVRTFEAEYKDVTLTLIADVTRSYVQYRAAQKQALIAQKNLDIQIETLDLVKEQYKYGEAPKLDVERAENLVNTTKASIPDFLRLADNFRLQLSVLTGDLPEDIAPILQEPSDIPQTQVELVLLKPSDVLTQRPDIQASIANLASKTSLTKTAIAELFPTFTLEGLFGYSRAAFSGTEMIWRIALGTAATLMDFGRIEGAIDVARAQEIQAFESMRKTVLQAVTEVETALSDTAHINEKRVSLLKAYENAQQSLKLSQTLYKEGEISFLDVLDVQRIANNAEAALVTAEAEQAESYIRLNKSLGVY